MSREDVSTPHTPVAIVGAGPVGLALALGLARHGVNSVLVERRPTTNEQSRAPALHLRTMEIMRQWGCAEPLLAAGTLKRSLPLYPGVGRTKPLLTFDFGELDDEAASPGVVFLEQGRTERLLLEELRSTGRCDIRFSTEAVAVEPRPDDVLLTLRHAGADHRLTSDYLVGCDGTSSFVRRAIGLPFEGFTYPIRPILADVRITDSRDALPWPRFHHDARGFTAAQRLAPQHWRIIRVEPGEPAPDERVSESEIAARTREVLGSGPTPVLWASRFVFQRRDAPSYRQGRVMLAGDAAHAFPPANGQGMNAGIQDAHNLAWKLAHALAGGDIERLLTSYDQERRSVVGTVSRHVSLLTRVGIQAPHLIRSAVIQLMRLGLAHPRTRRQRLRNMAMIDLDLPPSPLLEARGRSAAGIRLPDVSLRTTGGGRTRLYDLLPAGPSLIELTDAPSRDRAMDQLPVATTVHVGNGHLRDPTGSLRRLIGGEPGWILVRPDLHVGWTGTRGDQVTAGADRALGW